MRTNVPINKETDILRVFIFFHTLNFVLFFIYKFKALKYTYNIWGEIYMLESSKGNCDYRNLRIPSFSSEISFGLHYQMGLK